VSVDVQPEERARRPQRNGYNVALCGTTKLCRTSRGGPNLKGAQRLQDATLYAGLAQE